MSQGIHHGAQSHGNVENISSGGTPERSLDRRPPEKEMVADGDLALERRKTRMLPHLVQRENRWKSQTRRFSAITAFARPVDIDLCGGLRTPPARVIVPCLHQPHNKLFPSSPAHTLSCILWTCGVGRLVHPERDRVDIVRRLAARPG